MPSWLRKNLVFLLFSIFLLHSIKNAYAFSAAHDSIIEEYVSQEPHSQEPAVQKSISQKPAQRLLVYFTGESDYEQEKQAFDCMLNESGERLGVLADHSDKHRWVVVMSGDVNAFAINEVSECFQLIDVVRTVELDGLKYY